MHRNSQLRYYNRDYIYFITTNTYARFPFFTDDTICKLFIEELNLCKQVKQFKLYAFNILHDHVHLLLRPCEKYNVSQVMKSLKENFSRDVNRIIVPGIYRDNSSSSETSTSRLRINTFIKMFSNSSLFCNLPKFKLQRSFHDHIIRDEEDFGSHYHYTVYNHIKHKYSKEHTYTSLSYPKLVDIVSEEF